ncbi:MAG: TonB family protein [Bryobacteraceae bacterium]
MAQPLDILDEKDPLRGPLVGSLLLHAAIVGVLLFYWYVINRPRASFGEQNPGGGPSFSVSPVKSIPIPQQQAPPNPVAHDTQATVPAPAAKQTTVEKQPEKSVVELQEKRQRKKETRHPRQQQHYVQPAPPNQVYSRSAPAVSNPMYAGPSGSGHVGLGPNSPFGTRLGWYAEIVRQRIAQNWSTNGLYAASQMSPAIVGFTIERNGSVRNIQIVQSSGNPSIDNTALRAVYKANPLPPLPSQVSGNSISAQFTFNLR